jgi:GNAT superfamily N-acetyltransferase|tara:strand:+ start:716 stop:1156 length:441 start_codon:yes stop_codon:yes gene_type:complete
MELRRANALDISALIHLIMKMHSEAEVKIPTLDVGKVTDSVVNAMKVGVVVVAINEDKKLIGSIGGFAAEDWFSKEKLLGDLWFFVLEEYRKTKAGISLIKEFINVGKEAKLNIRLGHIYFGDIERKDNFYEKLGFVKAGCTYVEK